MLPENLRSVFIERSEVTGIGREVFFWWVWGGAHPFNLLLTEEGKMKELSCSGTRIQNDLDLDMCVMSRIPSLRSNKNGWPLHPR